MRLSFFFLFFSLLNVFNLNAQISCQYTSDGQWLNACCMGGADCFKAGEALGYCHSNDLSSPACQATLNCLENHINCAACLPTWGVKYCTTQSLR